jgi:hypothetical protein
MNDRFTIVGRAGQGRLLAARSFESSRWVAESPIQTAMSFELELLPIWSDHRDRSERRLIGSKRSFVSIKATGRNGSICDGR